MRMLSSCFARITAVPCETIKHDLQHASKKLHRVYDNRAKLNGYPNRTDVDSKSWVLYKKKTPTELVRVS